MRIKRSMNDNVLLEEYYTWLCDLVQPNKEDRSYFLLMDTLDELRTYGVLSLDNKTPSHYLLQISPNLVTVEHIRRYLWQGDPAQQQQAQQVKQQAGLSDSWLNDLMTKPRQTLQEALPLPTTLKQQP